MISRSSIKTQAKAAIPDLVRITDGESVCILCPSLGGSITSWSVGGQEMLRCADTAAIASGDPLAMASFPLVPFSNRIGHAQFMWAGRKIELTPNIAPEPHAIHGVGWKKPWAIAEVTDVHCVLTMRHQADACWPWPFEATQSFALKDGRLEVKLSATNLADEPVPLAFGHHPYFDQEGASLSFHATRVLLSSADALPTEAISPAGELNFSDVHAVEGRDIDHCYAGWDGNARITWAGRPHALAITTDMTAAVVYIPKGGAAFCFEPVPHINNALNRPGEAPSMPIIQPGESASRTIVLIAVLV